MSANISPSRQIEQALELFEPPPDAVYTIEATAHLVDVPRRTILVYCRHGLVSPAIDASDNGYYFDRNGIRELRRIDALRAICGDDLPAIKIILELMKKVERLQSEVRTLRDGEGRHVKKQKVSERRKQNEWKC
jgi:DNA-binding transcriptional MerR regulator